MDGNAEEEGAEQPPEGGEVGAGECYYAKLPGVLPRSATCSLPQYSTEGASAAEAACFEAWNGKATVERAEQEQLPLQQQQQTQLAAPAEATVRDRSRTHRNYLKKRKKKLKKQRLLQQQLEQQLGQQIGQQIGQEQQLQMTEDGQLLPQTAAAGEVIAAPQLSRPAASLSLPATQPLEMEQQPQPQQQPQQQRQHRYADPR